MSETAGRLSWNETPEDGVPTVGLRHAAPGGLSPFRLDWRVPAGTEVRRVGKAAVWTEDGAEWCLVSGVLPDDPAAPRGEQTYSAFCNLERELRGAGFAFSDVVRTWLYMDRVLEWYSDLNAARDRFFRERSVYAGTVPASTGIGSANAWGTAIVTGAIACRGATVTALPSPLQCPALEYGSSFSRAVEVAAPSGKRRVYVSGTASIEPNSHAVAHPGDVAAQTDCTLRAVGAILESRGLGFGDVTRAVAYLKSASSLGVWQAWLEAHGLPRDFAKVMVADVCRDGWLFEIEVDAEGTGKVPAPQGKSTGKMPVPQGE